MIVEINVKRVVVLCRSTGTDKVVIYTHNLPPSVHPYNECGSLVMDVAKGSGVQYVRENFNVEPEIISC